ncbi:MAG: CBS domain-containing protein [Candidatus Micrarchaeota archaeon]|nr:CBS domain-containing protein [Candidatus Micrarchaeota archaeon]
MEEAFPNVLPTTPVSSVASLLRHHAAVIVMRKGKVAGIITKADVLRSA